MDISKVKRNLGRKILYNDTEYVLSACIIRISEEGFFYQAEIQDITALRSVVICRLEDLKEII